jgi:hypothetical protein
MAMRLRAAAMSRITTVDEEHEKQAVVDEDAAGAGGDAPGGEEC